MDSTTPSLRDQIPEEVYIGPYTYKVIVENETWFNKHGVYGLMDRRDMTLSVYLGPDFPTVFDTLLHECLHSMWDMMHLDDSDAEEATVSRLSTALTMFFRDNPGVVDLLYNLQPACLCDEAEAMLEELDEDNDE